MVWGLLHLHTNVYLCVFTFLRLWDAGNLSWLCECLENKVGINGLDKAGNTALYWGCHGGHKGNRSVTDARANTHTLSFFSFLNDRANACQPANTHTLLWDVWQFYVVLSFLWQMWWRCCWGSLALSWTSRWEEQFTHLENAVSGKFLWLIKK